MRTRGNCRLGSSGAGLQVGGERREQPQPGGNRTRQAIVVQPSMNTKGRGACGEGEEVAGGWGGSVGQQGCVWPVVEVDGSTRRGLGVIPPAQWWWWGGQVIEARGADQQ